MKARIKSTGDIFPIAPYAKVTLNVCDDRGTPYEVDFEDIELMPDNISESDMDWSSFRREAAKDILAGMLSHPRILYNESLRPEHVRTAISYTDELIRHLKQE